jgi:hypothetical protein
MTARDAPPPDPARRPLDAPTESVPVPEPQDLHAYGVHHGVLFEREPPPASVLEVERARPAEAGPASTRWRRRSGGRALHREKAAPR